MKDTKMAENPLDDHLRLHDGTSEKCQKILNFPKKFPEPSSGSWSCRNAQTGCSGCASVPGGHAQRPSMHSAGGSHSLCALHEEPTSSKKSGKQVDQGVKFQKSSRRLKRDLLKKLREYK